MAFTNNWPVGPSNPATVGGTGTAPKYFQYPSANFTSGVTPNPGPSATSGYGQLAASESLNGQIFTIQAAGDFEVGSGGACPSATIDIVINTGTLVSPIWSIIATTGAVTAQNATGIFYPWFLSAKCNGTTASGTLNGIQSGSVDNTNSTPASGHLTSTISGLNFSAQPVFGLAVRITFSVSESGNSANLYQFSIDQ